MSAKAEATVRLRLLGSRLRGLRRAAGVSCADAARRSPLSEHELAQIEAGLMKVAPRTVSGLLTLYGVREGAERWAVLELAARSTAYDWWQRCGAPFPDGPVAYAGLEDTALAIRSYRVQRVPDLLQTEEYALAALRTTYRGDLAGRLDLRTRRVRALARPGPPRLNAVIDETALRRPVGGPTVMRGQLDRLIASCDLPDVTVQVMPLRPGAFAAEGGEFTILRFAEPCLPDVVHVEHLTGALFIDRRENVVQYASAMDRLTGSAATPEETVRILERIRAEL